MRFEWDLAKNEVNQQKHEIAFEDVVELFGRKTLEFEDNRKNYGETRMIAYGEVQGLLLCVVYTWRGQNRRIISARIANERERSLYNGQN